MSIRHTPHNLGMSPQPSPIRHCIYWHFRLRLAQASVAIQAYVCFLASRAHARGQPSLVQKQLPPAESRLLAIAFEQIDFNGGSPQFFCRDPWPGPCVPAWVQQVSYRLRVLKAAVFTSYELLPTLFLPSLHRANTAGDPGPRAPTTFAAQIFILHLIREVVPVSF